MTASWFNVDYVQIDTVSECSTEQLSSLTSASDTSQKNLVYKGRQTGIG